MATARGLLRQCRRSQLVSGHWAPCSNASASSLCLRGHGGGSALTAVRTEVASGPGVSPSRASCSSCGCKDQGLQWVLGDAQGKGRSAQAFAMATTQASGEKGWTEPHQRHRLGDGPEQRSWRGRPLSSCRVWRLLRRCQHGRWSECPRQGPTHRAAPRVRGEPTGRAVQSSGRSFRPCWRSKGSSLGRADSSGGPHAPLQAPVLLPGCLLPGPSAAAA